MDRGCRFLFIDPPDALFAGGCATLFSDGLAGCEAGSAVYEYTAGTDRFDFVCNVGGAA